MNENNIRITVELCPEDRARLDKIIERLGAVQPHDCSKCVKDVASFMDKAAEAIDAKKAEEKPQEDIREMLTKALNPTEEATPEEAPKNAQDAPETSTQSTTHEEEKQPTTKAEPSDAPAPTISEAELKVKVVTLLAGPKAEQVREIVRSYAPTVSRVPEDKRAECYAKLVELEG